MPKSKKVDKELSWLKSELKNYEIETINPIGETENSVLFYLETNAGYHLAINATINENYDSNHFNLMLDCLFISK